MTLASGTQSIPIQVNPAGVVLVGETRVTLDTIVQAYWNGDSPEVIAEHYPSLVLSDVYYAIAYYLSHRDEVDAYLQVRQREAAALRADIERKHSSMALKARLLARKASQEKDASSESGRA